MVEGSLNTPRILISIQACAWGFGFPSRAWGLGYKLQDSASLTYFRLVLGFSCRLRTPKVSRTAGTVGHDFGFRAYVFGWDSLLMADACRKVASGRRKH